MQSISSFLWILLSNDLHRQNIRQIPDREYLCFWEVAFLHVHWFWKLTFLQTSLQKKYDLRPFFGDKKKDAPFFVVIWMTADLRLFSTIWLKSIDVSDEIFWWMFYSSHESSDQMILESTSTYPNRTKSSQIRWSKNLKSLGRWGFSLNPKPPWKKWKNKGGKSTKIGLQRTFNIQLNVVMEAFLKCFNGWFFLVSLWKCHPVNHGNGPSTHMFDA